MTYYETSTLFQIAFTESPSGQDNLAQQIQDKTDIVHEAKVVGRHVYVRTHKVTSNEAVKDAVNAVMEMSLALVTAMPPESSYARILERAMPAPAVLAAA